ncbi:MAG: hypothetical protein JXR94_21085 [Candidatus Hydrogenedentes bacterium]|nr:hypothetical protein [Candidatus Hydrogenedentota bacterium]
MPVVLFALAASSEPAAEPTEIRCPGDYGGHLQGVATDQRDAIFWSFTVQLVKTDIHGAILAKVDVPNHHGDLEYHDGQVYVAVNLGAFNQEPGQADSWIYVYNAGDLALIGRHEAPELVHGAGGMAYHNGRFIVIGGLPEGYNENYAYEYDEDLKFIKRHVVDSGYTRMGIQTAGYFKGHWWFGCYEDHKGLLKCDESFHVVGRYDPNYAVGIAQLTPAQCLRGITERVEGTKRYTGRVVIDVPGKETPAPPAE